MVATQPTFNQVLNWACMLSFGEQQQLIDHVQGNIYEHIQRVHDTPGELKMRLRKAHSQARANEVYSEEEASQIMHNFVQQHLA